MHKKISVELNENLDDLEVRNPKAYKKLDRELELLKIKSDLALAASPIGIRDMERGK